MKSTLDAAEALLGTLEAARTHLLLIASQNLSVEDSLAFGAGSRLGSSPERALLSVATISLDLARVASGLAPGPGVDAGSETADEPITRPDSPLPESVSSRSRPPAAAVHAVPGPGSDSGVDAAEPAAVRVAPLPESQEAPSAAEEAQAAPPPTFTEAVERAPSAAAPPGFRVDDLVRGSLPEPLLPPWARAPEAAPARPSKEPSEPEAVSSPTDAPDAPALATPLSPSLLAAVGRPKARGPSLGPAVAAAVPSSPGPSGSGRDPWAPPSSPRPSRGAPEVLEQDASSERAGVAAVQILGVGSARTLSPTLALDGATGPADAEGMRTDAAADASGDFELDFEEPEQGSEDEVRDEVPELTAAESTSPDSPLIVTRDGVQHRDGARVADADVAVSQLDGLLFDAEAAEQRGNLREAVLHYSDLLSLKPSHAAAHLGRGRCLVELGDYGAAMSDFQRAEDLQPGRPEPLLEMGNLFYARKEYTKSISYYDQALEQSADFAMAWVRRGLCHQYLKDHEQAFADLQQAASLDADIPNLRMYIDMARKGMQRRGR